MLVNYCRAKEQPKIDMRGLQQLWNSHPNETPEILWKYDSACSGNGLSKRLRLERTTDHYEQASNSRVKPVVKILHVMLEETSFFLY